MASKRLKGKAGLNRSKKPSSSRKRLDAAKKSTGKKCIVKKSGGKKAVVKKRGNKKSAEQETPKPVPEILLLDPWKRHKSPYGGRASPADEYNILKKDAGVFLDLDRVAVLNVANNRGLDKLAIDHLIRGAVAKARKEEEQNAASQNEQEVANTKSSVYVVREGPADTEAANNFVHERVSAKSCDVATVNFSREVENSLVALDLTDNRLTMQSINGLNLTFLRELVLVGNALTGGFPNLSHLKLLIKVDLSYNPLGSCSGEHAEVTMTACDRLREVHLQGCKLGGTISLALNIRSATLEVLDISCNELNDRNDVLTLRKLNRLKSLSILGNPIVVGHNDSMDWCKMLAMKFGALKVFNGSEYSHTFNSINLGSLQLETADTGVSTGAGDDSASCSCVEGNPCAVSYNCKDWKNRFEVARKAREKLNEI
jgi:hypothetical protein